VGHVALPPEQVERLLEQTGAHRNPLAAHKTAPDGRPECGSWAYRGVGTNFTSLHPAVQTLLAAAALKQTHVMLFETAEGHTDIFAHREYNSVNPLVAPLHVAGVGLSPTLGAREVQIRLRGYLTQPSQRPGTY
jgi:hypothetical protein